MSTTAMETPLATALQLVNAAIGSLGEAQQAAQPSAESISTAQRALRLASDLLSRLDPYLDDNSSKGPPALQALIEETDKHDWQGAYKRKEVSFKVHPGWSAGGYEGSFIATIARSIKAKRVLEVGMFTGTTTLCVADALPRDGKIVALEMDAYFKKLSHPFFARAGVSEKVDVRIGAALDLIKGMVSTKEDPFDLIFIDADKTGYHDYYETIIGSGLLASDGVLLVDNTLFKGLPFTPELDKAGPELLGRLQMNSEYGTALSKFNRHVAQDKRVEATILPIRDGVTWIVHRQDG